MELKEKAAWIALFTVLVVAEIGNLYDAEKQQSDRFSSQTGALNTISENLGKTKTGLDNINIALGHTDLSFQATAQLINQGTKNTLRQIESVRTSIAQQNLQTMTYSSLAQLAKELAIQMVKLDRTYYWEDFKAGQAWGDRIGTQAPPEELKQLENDATTARTRLSIEKDRQAKKLITSAAPVCARMLEILGSDANEKDKKTCNSLASPVAPGDSLSGTADFLNRIATSAPSPDL